MPVTATTELADVTGLSFDASVEDELTALWDDVTDYGNYHVEHRESGTSTWTDNGTVPQDDTDLVISNLLDGEQYDIRVRAETEHVQSAWLQLSEVTLLPAPVLNTPTMTETTADLPWADNADNEDTYNIYRAKEYDRGFEEPTLIKTLAANSTSYTDATLSPGNTYRFSVEAETEHVTASDTVTVSTTAVDVPQKPVGSQGWHVEIEHPSGQMIQPPVIDDPKFLPEANSYPKVHIPVPRNEAWDKPAFEDGPMEVWRDGVRQEVDRLEDVEFTEDRTILKGRGGLELETRVTAEYDGKSYHEAAADLVTNNTNYAANVDDPPSAVLTNEPVQSADTESELRNRLLAPIPDDKPLEITSAGEVQPLQTAFTMEGENPSAGTYATKDDTAYSGGTTLQLMQDGEYAEWDITTEHTIPSGEFELFVRWDAEGDSSNLPTIRWLLDGTDLGYFSPATNTVHWDGLIQENGQLSDPGKITAGQYTLRAEVANAGTVDWDIDVVSPAHNRYPVTLDEDVSGSSTERVDGPETYPDQVDVIFTDIQTSYAIAGGRLELTSLTNTSGNQQLALSPDFGTTWKTQANTATFETDFAELHPSLRARIRLSRWGSRTGATPRTGFKGQKFDAYQLKADLDDTPMVVDSQYDGKLIDVLKEFAERSDSVFEYRRSGPTGQTESIEWTTPGQRQSGQTFDTVSYTAAKTTVDVVEKAIIYGQSQSITGESFTATAGQAITLNREKLLPAREQVSDPTDATKTYNRGIDYTMNYENGSITPTTSGALIDGATYEINYEYKTYGEYAKDGVTNPKQVVRTISALTTNRACGQAARQLVQELDVPRREAQLTIPPTKTGWSVVEDIDLGQVPTGGDTLHVNRIEEAANKRVLTLETRQTIQDVVTDIRDRIQAVSRKV